MQKREVDDSYCVQSYGSKEEFEKQALGRRYLMVQTTNDNDDVWVESFGCLRELRNKVLELIWSDWGLWFVWDLKKDRELDVVPSASFE